MSREYINNVVTTTTSTAFDIEHASSISFQCVIDVDTPAAVAFDAGDVTVASDSFTDAGHGLTTGLVGQLTTSAADLPNGLSTGTDYYVIVVDDDTFQLASSLANALAGTAVAVSDAGTGTHTFTPTAIAGGAVKLQKSNDGTNWSDYASATNITADATVWIEDDAPGYRFCRLHYTATAGRFSTTNLFHFKR